MPTPPSHRSPANRAAARLRGDLELRDELAGMAMTISQVDPRAGERLADLADAIRTDAGRMRWADVDLRRAFNTEHLSRTFAIKREGVKPKAVDLADKIRNILVLFPIFLTWFALAEASKAYQEYIALDESKLNRPFLYLWQTDGFGYLMSPISRLLAGSFTRVGIIDAVVIGVIIGLTFYSHGRREMHEDNIWEVSQAFQADLDNLLAEATVALSADRAGRPAQLATSVDRLAERFELSSQELLNRLRVEHDRLEAIASRREKELNDFGLFANGMRAGAEETHRLLADVRQVSVGLQHALEDLTSEVSVTGEQQRSLLKVVNSLEHFVASGIQSDNNVTRHLADAAHALSQAADRSLAGADAAAQAGRVATEAVRGIAEIASSLATGQTRLEHALASETEANSQLADSLRSGMTGVAQTSRTLSDIQGSLVTLQGEFRRIADLGQEQSQSLSRLLTEQTAVSTGLTQVARDLGGRGRDGASDLNQLIQRLDTLTTILAGNSGSATDAAPEAEQPAARGRGVWPRRE